MKKFVLSITLLFIISLTSSAYSVTPLFFEKRIDNGGGYEEFILKNNTNKTARYKILFLPGLGKYGHMNKWVEYGPKIVTIKPKSQSVLKVYIKAPKDAPEGEYSTLLNAVTVPIPQIDKQNNDSIAAAAQLGLDISIEIVGYVGELKANLKINNLKVVELDEKKFAINFELENKTPKRGVYCTIDILGNNNEIETVEIGRIPLGKTETIKIIPGKIKKDNILGIRIRETSSNMEITKKEL